MDFLINEIENEFSIYLTCIISEGNSWRMEPDLGPNEGGPQ